MIIKKHHFFALATGLMLATQAAGADVLCKNTEGTVKIQTYALTGTATGDNDTFSFAAQKAAAILAADGAKSLLTGTVAPIPDRVGGKELFSLTDQDGNAVKLKTVTTFLPVNCTRVDCQWVETVTGTLTLDGTSHALKCSKTTF